MKELIQVPSRNAVYSLVAAGRIPGVLRVGRLIRFDPAVIENWIRGERRVEVERRNRRRAA